jgi:WD40 repeat protein
VRVFQVDNCSTTFQPKVPLNVGAAIVALHNSRYLAWVPSQKSANADGPNSFHFWDLALDRELTRFNLFEPIKGLRINAKFLAVILDTRTVVFQHQRLNRNAFNKAYSSELAVNSNETMTAPNRPHSLHGTTNNTFALASLHENLLVLPAQSPGQVQLITLKPEIESSTKRVLRAHKTALRCMALSPDGTLLATASIQGTLVRVYQCSTLDQILEFRRGMEMAVIYSIAFSPENRWLACTSDKGTLHVFDLQPDSIGDVAARNAASRMSTQHRRNPSQSQRQPTGAFIPPPSISGLSSASPSVTPSTAIAGTTTGTGSRQEYYQLLPHPPSATSPPPQSRGLTGPVLKPSPFTPRILTDTRSKSSIEFHIGNEPPYWQSVGSGTSSLYTWTVAPDGTRKRVKKTIPSLPGDPAGRPPKGHLVFDGENTIYSVGGGSDPRWERFDLRGTVVEGGEVVWKLHYVGFRKFLGKQYAD